MALKIAIAQDNLYIIRGDTFEFDIPVKNKDKSNFDLTGFSWTFTAKDSAGVSAISTTHACDVSPTSGVVQVTLPSDETAVGIKTYDYDVEVRNTDTPPVVKTVALGKAILIQDVTT